MTFVQFVGIRWPEDPWKIVTVSIKDVQAFVSSSPKIKRQRH
jgi:hypothetical protein